MKVKIFPSLIVIIFLIIFFIFYKGLQNSNIYIPQSDFEKDIPNFKVKIFEYNNKNGWYKLVRTEDLDTSKISNYDRSHGID